MSGGAGQPERGRSGSPAWCRPCMVMHVGKRGGSRTWRGLLGRRADWGIGTDHRADEGRCAYTGRFGKGSVWLVLFGAQLGGQDYGAITTRLAFIRQSGCGYLSTCLA
jgi:hypothetical protein